MELAPGEMLGPYRLVDKVGVGGMAEVWRAYQARLQRHVVDGSPQRPDGQLLPALDPDEYLVLVGHVYAEDPEFATDFEPGRGFTIHISVR